MITISFFLSFSFPHQTTKKEPLGLIGGSRADTRANDHMQIPVAYLQVPSAEHARFARKCTPSWTSVS